MPITFGYWGFKGPGEPCRLTMALAGQKWTEYNPESPEAWGEKKAASDQDFPNLPFLEVDGYKITESKAILWYIAKKFRPEIVGKTIEEEGQVLQVLGVISDVRTELHKAVFSPEYKENLTKATSEGKMPQKLALLSKFLGENTYLVGNHVTIADVFVAFIIYMIGIITSSAEVENPVSKHPNLVALEKTVWATEGIAEYVASDAWKRPPIPPSRLPWIKF